VRAIEGCPSTAIKLNSSVLPNEPVVCLGRAHEYARSQRLHRPSEGETTAYQGNVSASGVRIGELFRDAVRRNAKGLILVHNHPSGDPTPSPDDLHLTALAAGRLLDVELLDHLVIGHDAYVSLRDRGSSFDRPGRHPPPA
jgi:hypothetical protein